MTAERISECQAMVNVGMQPYLSLADAKYLLDAAEEAGRLREYEAAIKSRHNGYDAGARQSMPDLREPSSPGEAIDQLLTEAEEVSREHLTKLQADNERLREAAIRLHRSRCTEDNCVLDGNPEHAAAFATAALEGKA